eukprot:GHVU01110582.1.p2 GENE.GHVU01110582.1~~GHVU01110582.1.p2  ORF type:complete len:105 (+),score=4.56 GHVU01110582.1:370-684(+)
MHPCIHALPQSSRVVVVVMQVISSNSFIHSFIHCLHSTRWGLMTLPDDDALVHHQSKYYFTHSVVLPIRNCIIIIVVTSQSSSWVRRTIVYSRPTSLIADSLVA